MSTDSDNETALAAARANLPMERLLTQYGHGPTKAGETWKRFTCPFCKKSKRAGIFAAKEGRTMLKCHGNGCATQKACDEIGLVMRLSGTSDRTEGFKLYLKMAEVKDRRPSQLGEHHPQKAVEATADAKAAVAPAVRDLSEAPPPVNEAGPNSAPEAPSTPPEEVTNPAAIVPAATAGEVEAATKIIKVRRGAKGIEAQLEAEAAETAKETHTPTAVAEPQPSSEISENERKARAARRDFYDRLTLSEEDNERLFKKRGLTTATSRALGYRSNPKSNLALLLEVAKNHSTKVMVEAGLFQRTSTGECVPVSQFYGKGLVGLKDEEGKEIWGWTYPILIPYWGADGSLIGLRPHKGGPRSSDACRSRCYVARGSLVDGRKYPRVLVTESEFKAAAVWQTLSGPEVPAWERCGACALAGIQMSRVDEVLEDLEQYLRWAEAKQIVVCFDNEEKSDPNLPGYKEQKAKRYDTPLYAAYLARVLVKMGFAAEVACLPDAYRVEGKADLDGTVAGLVSGKLDLKAGLEPTTAECDEE